MVKRALIIISIIAFSCKGKEATDVQVTKVKKGIFTEELTEQGSVEAVNSISIGAPTISSRYGALKIAKIVEDGAEVQKGDTIMIFEPSEIKRAIIQAEQQLEIVKAEYEKLKSTQQSEIEDLEADLELARISQEISQINFETSTYEPEATKKEIKLKLESATIALNRAKGQIDNKKIIHRGDLRQKELSINQLQATLDDANNSMKNLYVVSPANGIAIKEENWNSGQKWAVGDQPYSGSQIIELPDLASMNVEVKINEVDISKITPDQKVIIRPDAYSDSVYYGKVVSIANLAQDLDYKSKIKIFPVSINVNGHSKTLLPGLTVSCRIIVKELQDVIYIPLESLFTEEGVSFVYVKSGSGFRKNIIKTGAVNTDFAIVSEGLSGNEVIALSNPYLNKEVIKEKEKGNGSKPGKTASKL
jgi:HlyD family secretion protein